MAFSGKLMWRIPGILLDRKQIYAGSLARAMWLSGVSECERNEARGPQGFQGRAETVLVRCWSIPGFPPIISPEPWMAMAIFITRYNCFIYYKFSLLTLFFFIYNYICEINYFVVNPFSSERTITSFLSISSFDE